MRDTLETLALPEGSTLIIGAGVAGLFTALKLAPNPVTVISAAPIGRGASSTWAQGGLAAAMGEDDTPDLHFRDTIDAGAGLVEPKAARILTEDGPARVHDLIDFGVAFDTDENGKLKLGREAAHSRKRIVHATGDRAGAAIMATLDEAAHAADHITLRERMVAEDLITDDSGRVIGALVHDITEQKRLLMLCPRTVLATGGLGGLYAVTTNPVRAQGHGLAMALRAGAEIIDPEFVQFHPTALDVGIDPAPLATEALRGEGAILVNGKGRRFMKYLHDDAELAPRDIVARGVAQAVHNGGAFLDAREAIGAAFPEKFPTVYAACREAGIDPVTELMPVAPAVHYHMGGVGTDVDGRTSRPGLWAVGEVASTGIHGANRLASNSLLEALVFGARAADSLKQDDATLDPSSINLLPDRLSLDPKPPVAEDIALLRRTMAYRAGILREKDGLMAAMEVIGELEERPSLNSGMLNCLLTATMILAGALDRRESRGSHFRTDYPEKASPPPVHTVMTFSPETGLVVSPRPIDYKTDLEKA
ncbi:L-aspartate oxidase [Parvularcula flava]|uniref:L-aspartate oxidase n=1 Tax=Aquisalinus luteolus TaxID=1566827 RepID=A0A8J3A697_9PROT|nr:L-aspartate oxidase [Aquisalinus luteolus]NHK28937.1 L-aspartate oxidase [Aquisalinus luteolus]GGI00803.1 L-aspartate oxidase [Aquisalinus luteolus]